MRGQFWESRWQGVFRGSLHTIIRLPKSVFAPYTSITTNVLFFDKNGDGTEKTWFYRMDLPDGYKAFSKTKPIMNKHFQVVTDWVKNREEICDEDGNYKAKAYTKAELEERNYNFDLCGFPNVVEEVLEPDVLIRDYQAQRATLNQEIDGILADTMSLLEGES